MAGRLLARVLAEPERDDARVRQLIAEREAARAEYACFEVQRGRWRREGPRTWEASACAQVLKHQHGSELEGKVASWS